MVDERIAVRRAGSYTLTATAYDPAGDPAEISAPVSVTMRDSLGNLIEAAGGVPAIEAGVLTHIFPHTALEHLGVYDVIWTGVVEGQAQEWVTRFELVGDFYYTLAELRASDSSYDDEISYPDAKLSEAREWAESTFEHEKACAVAFVPRAATERIVVPRWDKALRLKWPAIRRVVALKIDGVTESFTGLAVGDRTVKRFEGWNAGSVVEITYEHGYDAPNPQVRKAALMLAKEYLVDSALSSRATAESTDVGFYRLSIAGPDGRTGIPYVDAVIADNRRSVPVF